MAAKEKPLCPRCGRTRPGKQCAGHECPLKRGLLSAANGGDS